MPPKSEFSQILHLEIRAIPGAAKTQLVGWYGSAMKVRVAAPPEDNAANKALAQWLRKALQAESVEVVAGQSGRSKVLKRGRRHFGSRRRKFAPRCATFAAGRRAGAPQTHSRSGAGLWCADFYRHLQTRRNANHARYGRRHHQ